MRVSQIHQARPVHGIIQECHNPLLPENTVRSLENASPKLPREVSDMFVGEAFQGYINVAVDSPKVNTLYDVTLKVELSCPAVGEECVKLLDTSDDPLRVLAKECPVEQVVSTRGKFSLAVPSIHILQVQIRYALSPGGEALYFKRSYKFPVVAPLAVHHEAVQLDNRILCNISVTSSHPSAHIAIFGVGVEPIRGFLSEPVGDTRGTRVLAPKEVSAAEYVFELKPQGSSVDISYVRELVSYGTFKFQWRCPQLGSASDSILGVRQKLELRPIPQQELDLRIAVTDEAPPRVDGLPKGVLAATVEKPFSVEVKVVNNSDRDIVVGIDYDVDGMAELQMAGLTERTLGTIKAFSSVPLSLSLFPFAAGIFTLGPGISLRDMDTDARYQVSSFAQVVCLPSS